jgi:hypothetical protein
MTSRKSKNGIEEVWLRACAEWNYDLEMSFRISEVKLGWE